MVDFTLTDEQKDLRELAHSFAEKDMRSVAWEYDKDGDLAAGRDRQGLGGRVDEHPRPRGLRRSRPRLPLRLPDRGGVRLGLFRHRHLAGRQRPRLRPDHPRRLRGDEKEVPGDADRSPEARLLLPDRARRRLRRQRHEDQGREEGRQVRHQRLQVLHHQRHLRRLLHGLRQDRPRGRSPRHQRLRRRRRPPRGHRRQEGGQDGPAGVQHRDHLLRRSRDPGREPAGRGKQGIQAGDDDPRPHPPRRLGDGCRHWPRGARVRRPSTPKKGSSSGSRSRCTRRSSS